MSDLIEPSVLGGSSNNRQLLRTSQVGLGALLAYSLYKGWELPQEELIPALVCILLAAWPMLRWLRHQNYPFPAFETFMLSSITAYAMPLLTDNQLVDRYPEHVLVTSICGIILFQLSALFAFTRTRALERKTPFWMDPLFTRQINSWLHWGLWLNVLFVCINFFTTWIPYDIDSILRAIFFGIGTACTFLLGRSWGNDELNPKAKASVVAALLITAIIQISSLYLINTISAVLVFFLAYVSAGKRIPFVPLVGLFLILTVLHNGKAQMREIYWTEGAPAVGLAQLPDFFGEWIQYGIQPFTGDNPAVKKRALLDRASLLQIMCLVVDSTEKGKPSLMGETYGYVLPMLVPRILWPEKPSGQITVSRLAIYYGLQDESSARTTSIGFGMPAEAYANFGMYGLVGLGLAIGFFAKIITIWTRASPLLSNGGLIMILLMAWSMQIELSMSGWVSSFYQASVCMLGIPYVIRRLFN